jgi:hypothetical protein
MAAADESQPTPRTIAVTYATDPGLCERFICHQSGRGESCGYGFLQDYSGSGDYFVPAPGGRELDGAKPHGGKVYEIDFDNDGREDRVLWVSDYTHYFDGDYFVILSDDVDLEAKLKRNAQRDSDTDTDAAVQWAEAAGLSVYSGRQTPYKAVRYTHFRPIIIDGMTLLWVFPQNDEWPPTALIYKPRPNSVLERICEYQRVEKQ